MSKTSPQKGSTTPEKNITVEFPGVKLKIRTEGLTLEALEEMVFDIVRGIGQKAIVGALEEYNEILLIGEMLEPEIAENYTMKCFSEKNLTKELGNYLKKDV